MSCNEPRIEGVSVPAGEGADRPDATRRHFLSQGCQALTFLAFGSAVGEGPPASPQGAGKPIAGEAEVPSGPAPYDPREHSYAYLVDISKCIGCGSCVRACEKENNVPEHYFRTWVERYTVSRRGEVEVDSPNGARDGFPEKVTGKDVTKAFFVPKICNHCKSTPCVQLCPVGASYQTADGVVLVDEERCIGCGYCVQACPYGSRFIHPIKHVASKCTFCYHRVTKGLKPACVQACPVGARQFGDTEDPKDEVANIVATQPVRVLKPELMTEPNCFYLGLGKEVS